MSFSQCVIPIIILCIVILGFSRGVKVYDCFVEGAKDGLNICIRIFPYLLAMLLAVGLIRESGAMDFAIKKMGIITNKVDLPSEVIPLILMKPLSGSGSLGIFTEIIKTYGPDTYIGILASIIMGTTETIFYTISVYFGAVKIKKIRHTLWAALMADLVAIISAICFAKIIFSRIM
ncbi:spore maturation protein B [Hathewaya proteolytica DSM 3090]|uniref:Spore maturation protein B n=1 Tax=Hathewaya proteolytica DSM 3090 TaxID=1121331 RepID=A0A1M6PHZ5_9CLOT|nr:spore maturation protein [Hathewaya proteolytica]SHK07559.1 spore maturation protein B [Hathewaya proteolytica DSM 3090]